MTLAELITGVTPYADKYLTPIQVRSELPRHAAPSTESAWARVKKCSYLFLLPLVQGLRGPGQGVQALGQVAQVERSRVTGLWPDLISGMTLHADPQYLTPIQVSRDSEVDRVTCPQPAVWWLYCRILKGDACVCTFIAPDEGRKGRNA